MRYFGGVTAEESTVVDLAYETVTLDHYHPSLHTFAKVITDKNLTEDVHELLKDHRERDGERKKKQSDRVLRMLSGYHALSNLHQIALELLRRYE